MSTLRSPQCLKKLCPLLFLLLAAPVAGDEKDQPRPPTPLAELKLSADAAMVSDSRQLMRALLAVPPEPWKPKVNDATPRGAGADVFAQVAPGVVVVHWGQGHGTGFVIDPAGWIITNHHVIEHAFIDKATAAQTATVYLGRLKEDGMELVEPGLKAHVYQFDLGLDLALLKVDVPKNMGRLPALKMALKTPRVGEDCFAVGHPGAGLLWTLRSGAVSGAGKDPAHMTDFVAAKLAQTEAEKERIEKQLSSAPQRTILLSTCGLNPGDSGGPLLSKEGEVIAVSVAVPKIRGDIDFAKFSYHIHLQELQAFVKANDALIKSKSPTPPPVVPSIFPAARFEEWQDSDRDGQNDTLVFSLERGATFTGVMLDLDQNSGPAIAKKSAAKTPAKSPAANKPAAKTLEKPKEDFEFALHHYPFKRTFYDTDDDGQMDLIASDVDADGRVDFVLKYEQGQWKRHDADGAKLIDPSRFAKASQRERFRAIMFPANTSSGSAPHRPLEAPPAR